MKKLAILFLFLIVPLNAQQISNVNFEIVETHAVVYYDLSGDDNTEYEVSLILKREEADAFVFEPKTLSGDFGKKISPGKKKRIVWAMQSEYFIDPEVKDFYFEVVAKEPSSKSFWYYISGIALAGGATAAILISNHKDTPAAVESIGSAPDRPK